LLLPSWLFFVSRARWKKKALLLLSLTWPLLFVSSFITASSDGREKRSRRRVWDDLPRKRRKDRKDRKARVVSVWMIDDEDVRLRKRRPSVHDYS